jgi:hypothetical protein
MQKDDLHTNKIEAEIAKLLAETSKLNKDLKWYEVTIIVAVTLAVVAITKIFLT